MIKIKTQKNKNAHKTMKNYKVLCDNKVIEVSNRLDVRYNDNSLPFDRKLKVVSKSPITYDVIANNCLEALDIAKKTYFAQFNRNPFSAEVNEKVAVVSMNNQLAQVA